MTDTAVCKQHCKRQWCSQSPMLWRLPAELGAYLTAVVVATSIAASMRPAALAATISGFHGNPLRFGAALVALLCLAS
jgi:predicted membrane-bound dolichyl-phosphate-mannose-protein mannosyltransferase